MLSFEMIQDAAKVLNGVTVVTPLLESSLLNETLGFRLIVKAECLQRTGSFKMRGAYVKISSLTETERKAGVVAYSSGNHAQGVAAAAAAMNVDATIVMPADAPAIKLQNTASYGAHVITYDRATGDRAKIAQDVSKETGATLIPPYDDYVLMSGQGTVGLEIAQQLEQMDTLADVLICPVGGGGLIAGVATAMAALSPHTKIYASEPDNFDDTRRSLMLGQRVANEPGHDSICDSIVTQMPGVKTFPINHNYLKGGFSVSDDETIIAMKTLATELKLVSEPGAAVAFAAAMKNRQELSGKTVVVVVSGGNLDLDTYKKYLD